MQTVKKVNLKIKRLYFGLTFSILMVHINIQ